MTRKCLVCGKEFETNDGRIKMCSDECRSQYKEYFKKKTSNELSGVENEDFIVCQWCGMKVKRIYGKHIQKFHPGKTSKDYSLEFPTHPLTCSRDKENTSKNAGKHMKSEYYKSMFSEKFRGENNPNHRSKTTEQQRKEISPFSKEFYTKRGLTETDREEFIKRALSDREFETRVDYWVKRGLSEEEAIGKIKERQITFSLNKCIEKYGEEKGLERWKQRQEKWLNNYKRNSYSKVSQVLFKQLYDLIKNNFNEIYFATIHDNKRNNEYTLKLSNRIVKPDFLVKDNNKIIEFDGIYWHQNSVVNKSREEQRDKSIMEGGYKILHIREDDFYDDPNGTIEKCITFIYE